MFADIARGKLRLLILYMLRDSPKHGYALMKALRSLFGRGPSPGTLYPMLRELLEEGLIEVRIRSSGGRIVKEYALTEEGVKYLEKHSAEVEELSRIVRAIDVVRRYQLDALGRVLKELLEVLPDLDEERLSRVLSVARECVEKLERVLEEVRRGG